MIVSMRPSFAGWPCQMIMWLSKVTVGSRPRSAWPFVARSSANGDCISARSIAAFGVFASRTMIRALRTPMRSWFGW
jgi:hypothetical protein